MAKILMEVKQDKFKKGDMLIWNGKQFVSVNQEYILKDIPNLYKELDGLKDKVAKLEATIKYDHGEITKEEYELCLGLNK